MSIAANRVRLSVQVTPCARHSTVMGVTEGVLRIRLRAQPVDGKANEALIRYLAEILGLPKSALSIVAGHTGRRKMIEVADIGLSAKALHARLEGIP